MMTIQDFDNPLTYDFRINTSVHESITTFLKHSIGFYRTTNSIGPLRIWTMVSNQTRI